MPPTNAAGKNTAARTSAIATTGPETSSMALRVASRGESPCSMCCSTASTTTIASSTTSPMARTRPNNDRVLIEKPSKGKTAKVPTSETGTARRGIRVARQFCRKINTTRTTRISASTSVWTISLIPSDTARVVSSETVYSRSSGNRVFNSSINCFALFIVSMALEPGSW